MKYDIKGLVELAKAAGFVGNDAAIMAAIAMAESSGDPNAVCHNTNGTEDYGLTQINTVHDKEHGAGWAQSSLDPNKAFANAAVVYKEAGNSFHPWVTYWKGLYKKYLPAAQSALSGDTVTPAYNEALSNFCAALATAFANLSKGLEK